MLRVFIFAQCSFEFLARFFLLETFSQREALFIGWLMTAVIAPLSLADDLVSGGDDMACRINSVNIVNRNIINYSC